MSNIQHGTRNIQVFDYQLIVAVQSSDYLQVGRHK